MPNVLEVSLDGGQSYMPVPATAVKIRVLERDEKGEVTHVELVGTLSPTTITVCTDPYDDDEGSSRRLTSI